MIPDRITRIARRRAPPTLLDRITAVNAIHDGRPIAEVADYFGVPITTIQGWIRDDRARARHLARKLAD